ncbi:MAG: helix-turn-helix domain-containing protein [Proteobacteria bacterium]|nr:helix-turn-helix domain-containing protein [Pseudomonadota bacterium]
MNLIPKPLSKSKDTVTLSRKSWEAMVEALEDAKDIRTVDAFLRRKDKSDAMPVAFVSRLLTGEPPVRVYREWRGMTATALSKAADVKQPYLSAIETGAKPGSASALKRIAGVLKVDLEDLVSE